MSSEPRYRDEEWLREQYVEEWRSTTDIADECGCDSSTVLKWLNRHSIETRAQAPQAPDKRLTDAGWLREQYVEQTKTACEISEVCECSPSAVYTWLDKHGIKKRSAKRRPSSQRLTDAEWLRGQYIEQRQRCADIAEKCECSADTVRRWLHRHDIEVRPRGGDGEHRAVDKQLTDSQWLRHQYVQDEKTAAEIAEAIGCSPSAVQNWLNKHGVQIDKNRYFRSDKLADRDWLREQYVEKERTGYEIADECDCSFSVVYEWIRKHGIETGYNGGLSGDEHPRWSGGQTPYGAGWNESKRETVRERDDYTCQNPRCSVTQSEHQDEHGEKLHVHHLRKARKIDDPEERNDPENLITLCRACHKRWEKMADAGLVPEVRR